MGAHQKNIYYNDLSKKIQFSFVSEGIVKEIYGIGYLFLN